MNNGTSWKLNVKGLGRILSFFHCSELARQGKECKQIGHKP